MAFGGYMSQDSGSQALDQQFWGSTRVPSNTVLTSDKKFIVTGTHTPWIAKYGLKKAVTMMDGGPMTPFHVNGANNHLVNVAKGISLMAAAATIQLSRPAITPVIVVGDPVDKNGQPLYGNTPGSPTASSVGGATQMVDLFNSNATLAAGALSNPQNAVLYEAYVKGLFGSSKSATIPTFTAGINAGKLASNLIGVNLASELTPTTADQARYGYTAAFPTKMTNLRDNLIVSAKALKLGLTSQVCIGSFFDDPHDLFTPDGGGGLCAASAGALYSGLLNAFMDDLMGAPDPFCPGVTLGDNTVICFIGDTPRTMCRRESWNDPTVGAQNRLWVMGNGMLKIGSFGGDRPLSAGGGNLTNTAGQPGPGEGGLWDLNTGDLIPFDENAGYTGAGEGTGTIGGSLNQQTICGQAACAAVLYAVTYGDTRTVNNFYPGPDYPAVQVPVVT
jgi:hypothetical protein